MKAFRFLCFLLSWLQAGALWAGEPTEGFRVKSVRFYVQNDTLFFDAQIDYRLSARALEALENGVPLILEVHLQLRAQDAWIWEDSLVDQRLRYRIQYKPLSKDYFVTQLPDEGGRSYVTRDAALSALGQLEALPLISRDRLRKDRQYELHLKAFLDIEALPLPLRPMAYLFPSWKLSTGWTRWPVPR